MQDIFIPVLCQVAQLPKNLIFCLEIGITLASLLGAQVNKMLFNSLEFFVFLPLTFLIYYVLNKHHNAQNLFLVVASYTFYGWWDWRFLGLIFISTVIDWWVGLKIQHAKGKYPKFYLGISLFSNLGILLFFKYYNFFVESFVEAFRAIGYEFNSVWILNIILPVGISFYTFQTLSYSIDVYRGKLKATNDIIAFAAFVSFFPQLVAGPIERATNLLPQMLNGRKFDYDLAVNGLRLILWGLFVKVVIADSLAPIVDDIFNNYQAYGGGTLIIGTVLFAFQIYGDFGGYSNIAIGLAHLFGFSLMSNFKFPYFSRDIAEFWRRWHISLSTWFRDYLYIPLGGSKEGKWIAIRNISIVFLVSGFWHGANWTFIMWGLIHALCYLPIFLRSKNRRYLDANEKLTLSDFLRILLTFSIVTLAWVFFRAENVEHALRYIWHMRNGLIAMPYGLEGIPYVVVIIVIDWLFRSNEREILNFRNPILRRSVYIIMSVIIFYYFQSKENFIYFQF